MHRVPKSARGLAAGLALLGCVVLAGCSGSGVHGVAIQGQLLQNGQAVKLGPGEQLQISFVSQQGEKPVVASAAYNPADGSFKVAGPTNRGIPEGTYRIAVSTSSYGPRAKSAGDRFRGAFSVKSSPLSCNIGSQEHRVVVDVGKRTVATQ